MLITKPSPPLFQKIDCIRLPVADLDAALAFYRDRLGHSLIWRTQSAAGLAMPHSDAEIVLYTEGGNEEIDFLVDSADEAAQRFEQAGGKVLVPPFDIQIGRCVVVQDPWGNELVLLDMSKGALVTDADGNILGNKNRKHSWLPVRKGNDEKMNYLQELRKLVGSRPLITTGATVLLLNQKNQLLMMLRTDNYCWGVPGGMMELGESLEETARRETNEEIGVAVTEMKLFGIYSGKELYYQYPNGDEIYNVSAAYLAYLDDPTLALEPSEHSEYRFFDLEALPENISPPIQPMLRDLIQRFSNTPSPR